MALIEIVDLPIQDGDFPWQTVPLPGRVPTVSRDQRGHVPWPRNFRHSPGILMDAFLMISAGKARTPE